MKRLIILVMILSLFFSGCITNLKTVRLDELDLGLIETEAGANYANLIYDSIPLSVGNAIYEHGIATSPTSMFLIKLSGKSLRFVAEAGIDNSTRRSPEANFMVFGDGKLLWESGKMNKGDAPKEADIDIRGVKRLGLLVKNESQSRGGMMAMMMGAGGPGGGPGEGPGSLGGPGGPGEGPGGEGPGGGPGFFRMSGFGDWANASIEYKGSKPPVAISNKVEQMPYILTPAVSATPKINGAKVVGATTGKDFLYTVAVTGERPIEVTAENLPSGMTLDPATGIITGTTPDEKREYIVKLKVSNSSGETEGELKIVIGDLLAQTPPLGWNSWNVWGSAIDEEKVRAAADAMAEKLRDHGWIYINIDDHWEAKERTSDGELMADENFPGMEGLGDYIHSKGLKLGIYSSPGPTTCGRQVGSYGHEYQDAGTWARWGVDYLKYDWCSYGQIVKGNTLEELQKPYLLMKDALDKSGRDVVYSLCQYGMGSVWEWGASVGGNLWRTSGDIEDEWESLLNTGFAQADNGSAPYAGPGHWNDPDMLVVGKVGWGPTLSPSGLTPDEQYTHISLWSIMAAPLLIGCDMTNMDDFTQSLLTNDEVLAVDQDPLGKQGEPVIKGEDYQVWAKDLENGSKAVAIFYLGKSETEPADLFNWDDKGPQPKEFTIKWSELGIEGKWNARDLWRQKDLGVFLGNFSTSVNHHGVVFLKLTPAQ